MIMLLKTVEEKFGESGVESLIKMVDIDDNTAMMIAVQSGSSDVAKVNETLAFLKLFKVKFLLEIG